MEKLCLIFNIPALYRKSIYEEIDKTYDCDWYFADTDSDIERMDTSNLHNVRFYKTVGNPNKAYWQRGIISLLFNRNYRRFLMVAETRSVSCWIFFWLAFLFFPHKKIHIWTHGWYGKESAWEAKMKLWLYRHVSRIFLYGNYAKKLLAEKGIPEEKMFVLHNSLDYRHHLALRQTIVPSPVFARHFHNDYPTIVFIGRLTRVKRLEMLVAALSELKRKDAYCNLVFVGDGVLREELEAQVVWDGLEEQVWFYGACYDDAKSAELIYNADLCVSPGNVGLTAIHALSFGTPVITHDCFARQMPEFESIVPGVTGDFFEQDRVESLTGVIERWLREKTSCREEVRASCFREIDTQWNPAFQIEVIKNNLDFAND